MWKLLATITFLTGGQPAEVVPPATNPIVVTHRLTFNTEAECQAVLKDDDQNGLEGLKLAIVVNQPRIAPEADDFKVELSCTEATGG